jgi:glycine/D-amino acid oxidase-like deaminating enzyme
MLRRTGTMTDTPPISLWDATAAEPDLAPEMEGDVTTDLAIVGGGFTGLSTALHAAERGIDCHVLEARQIGYGGSGRNVGLVNAGLWLPPQDVRAKLGEERGASLITTLGDAPGYVMSLIERHQIRCEATRTGTIHAAHSAAGYEDLARRTEEWHRLGAPVELLSRTETAAKIGSQAFHGGLLDRRAGTINPMGYVRGLARAALAAGAGLSVGVTARKLTRVADRWSIETDRGRVSARFVVLGTNAYTDDLWPGLKQTFTMIHYFQAATVPLGPLGHDILSERQGVWDTGRIMFSMRRDAFGRLIVGSMGRVIGGDKGLSRRWARRRIRTIFPELADIEFEKFWHGQIAMTPDHLPRIFRLAEGLYTPIGYNGRGITPGTMFGKAMAELLAGGNENDLPLPVANASRVGSAGLRSKIYDAAFTANQIRQAYTE